MRKKKTETVEFRFYEVPQGENVLGLLGESWNRVYGHDEQNLHFHNLMEIGFCRNGSGHLLLGDRDLTYRSGCITVIPENFPHTTISDGEKANFWEYLFFDPKVIVRKLYPDNTALQNSVIEKITRSPLVLEEMDAPALQRIINSVMEELRGKRVHYKKMVMAYMDALVIEIMRQYADAIEGGNDSARMINVSQISPAIEYINNNYRKSLKVKDVSDAIGMSETHFRRLFESYLNMPPMDYLNLIRVQNACEIMKKTNLSMEEVAEEVGFATTSTFNRNFKKFLDTSPYQWKINPDNYESKLLNYNISALKGWMENE